MMKWGAQQTGQLLMVTFTCWKEFLQKEKEDRALDEINQRMADLAAKGDSTLQKTMMKWGAQQAEQLVNITFTCWKEDYKEEQMSKHMMKLDEGKNVQMQKLMMKFA